MSHRDYTAPLGRLTTPVDWQRRLAGTNPQPIVVKGMHRVFWVPAKYVSVAAVLFDGRKHTNREIAARTGYSVKGAWAAIRALERMAILAVVTTVKGCKGWTRARVAADAQVQNVSTTVETFLKETRTVVETFIWGAPPGARTGLGAAALPAR